MTDINVSPLSKTLDLKNLRKQAKKPLIRPKHPHTQDPGRLLGLFTPFLKEPFLKSLTHSVREKGSSPGLSLEGGGLVCEWVCECVCEWGCVSLSVDVCESGDGWICDCVSVRGSVCVCVIVSEWVSVGMWEGWVRVGCVESVWLRVDGWVFMRVSVFAWVCGYNSVRWMGTFTFQSELDHRGRYFGWWIINATFKVPFTSRWNIYPWQSLTCITLFFYKNQ